MVEVDAGELQHVHEIVGLAGRLARQRYFRVVEGDGDALPRGGLRGRSAFGRLRLLLCRAVLRLGAAERLHRAQLVHPDVVAGVDGLIQRHRHAVDGHKPPVPGPHKVRRGSDGVRALLRRGEADVVPGVNHIGQLRRLAVEQNHRRRGQGGAVELPLAVEGKGQVRAGLADEVAVAVAVHHQDVPHDEHAASEELRRLAVEQNDVAVVDEPQPRGDGDAQRRGVLRVVEVVFVAEGVLFKVVSGNGDPGGLDAQLLRHPFLQALQLAAAAGEEHRRGHLAVELQNAPGQLLSKRGHRRGDQLPQLLGGGFVGDAQNVRVADLSLVVQGFFQPLRLLELHQQRPHEELCHLVPGDGGHGVAHHAAVPADGDVGGARADVHQHQIQKADVVGDGGVEGGNGLQRQAGDFQPQLAHHGVEALHHLPGQEGDHDLRLQLPAAVVADAGHGVTVDAVGGDGVAHHVIHVVLGRGFLPQGMLRLGHRAGLQLVDDLLGDLLGAGKIHRKGGALRLEGAPRRRHADPGKAELGFLFQARDHLPRHLGHLLDVLDLSIQHGALAVVLLLDGKHPEHPVLHPAHHADDAAGADVQRKDHVSVLFVFHFRHNRTCLLPNSVFTCRHVRRTGSQRVCSSWWCNGSPPWRTPPSSPAGSARPAGEACPTPCRRPRARPANPESAPAGCARWPSPTGRGRAQSRSCPRGTDPRCRPFPPARAPFRSGADQRVCF